MEWNSHVSGLYLYNNLQSNQEQTKGVIDDIFCFVGLTLFPLALFRSRKVAVPLRLQPRLSNKGNDVIHLQSQPRAIFGDLLLPSTDSKTLGTEIFSQKPLQQIHTLPLFKSACNSNKPPFEVSFNKFGFKEVVAESFIAFSGEFLENLQ